MKRFLVLLFLPAIALSQVGFGNGCLGASSQAELNVNNVRTTILGGGDMWWDLDNGKYEIPKDSDRHSMFAGSIWIGGLDAQGNLKVAAMTYRQDGSDFWPGPLNSDVGSDDYGTVDSYTCAEYDRHWSVYKNDVKDYVEYLDCVNDQNCDPDIYYPNYDIPEVILSWPGTIVNDDGTVEYLAPFNDVNDNGIYDVGLDYPGFNLEGDANCTNENVLFGHQSIWWVFNDKGNIHAESGSESAIGLEVHAQAFAFNSANAINDMTFYNYKIINRSSESLNQTYFGQWVDSDLGNYQDDYVGCDVELGLGYCYNGDSDDEGAAGYNYDSNDPPPAIGVDFFRGPLADDGDGIDNDRDGEIDEEGEQIIMSKFVYYNNDFSEHGNPENAYHYYGYLRGIWKNGQPMTYGGTGWEASNPECDFMFPGGTDTDLSSIYGGWTEVTAGNDPADRRFLQSAGPFTLEPGAVNYITSGVVWARAQVGNNLSSVALLKEYDQLAQSLFDICFDESLIDPSEFGCIDISAVNYDSDASYDNGSCIYAGCTDVEACNFAYWADVDDLSCEYCFYYAASYPMVAVFNNGTNAELVSSALGNAYSHWQGEENFSSSEFINVRCISPEDTCFTLPPNAFLINNISMEELSNMDSNTSNNWVSPIPDIDRFVPLGDNDIDIWQFGPAKFLRPQDWIRSGTNMASENNATLAPNHYYGDVSVNGTLFDLAGWGDQQTPLDPNEVFEFNGNPWLVPYKLLSTDYRGRVMQSTTTNVINSIDTIGGGLAWMDWKAECTLDSLINIDIVLTPDKTMWTRCPVLDMSEPALEWVGSGDPVTQSNGSNWPFGTGPNSSSYPWDFGEGTGENGEQKWDLRLDSNVDKYGNPDGTGGGFNEENGWGWFPGYAINTTTGERLNLMFSENSSLGAQYNADDMIFNPTPYIFDYGIGDDYFQSATITTMNGGHAVFILDTEYQEDNAADNPHYNSYTGSSQNNAWNALRKKQVIPHIMWVGYWLSSETEQWLENSITIQARIDGLYDQTIMNESCECDCIDDSDGDNICDEFDNCIDTYNPDQQDTDGDGLGDDCDQTPGFIEESLQNRSLIKVVDILGRDAYQQDFYIEIYDDGSIEKKYIIE